MARKKTVFDPQEFLARAGIGRAVSKYKTDQVIFAQGAPADAVFYVRRGKVKITVVSEEGREAVVAVVGPGTFLGEGCLAGQTLRMGTASAMTDCEVMRVEKAAMVRTLQAETALSEMFLAHVLARNIRVEEDLVDQLFNSSEKRLARTLLLLAQVRQGRRPEPILSKVSQETLAEMIGTTRSRVNHS